MKLRPDSSLETTYWLIMGQMARRALDEERFEEAHDQAQRVLAQTSQGVAAMHYVCACALLALRRDLLTAREHFDKALGLGFNPYWVYANRAALNLVLGDTEAARRDTAEAERSRSRPTELGGQ